MAANFLSGIMGSVGLGGGFNMMTIIYLFAIVIIAGLIIGGILWYVFNRAKWNLKVNFNLPRAVYQLKEGERLDINDIKGAIDGELGKGFYDVKKGVVWLKRKGKKKIAMKPFNINRFLKGNNVLDVVQVGSDDYIPVLPDSYLLMTDDTTGEQIVVGNLKADSSRNKAWKTQFERDAKSTYSIQGALSQLLSNPAFLIGLTIFLWGLQFLLLYNKIGK